MNIQICVRLRLAFVIGSEIRGVLRSRYAIPKTVNNGKRGYLFFLRTETLSTTLSLTVGEVSNYKTLL